MTRHDGNKLKIVTARGLGGGGVTFHQDKGSERLHNTLTLTHMPAHKHRLLCCTVHSPTFIHTLLAHTPLELH